MNIPSAGVSLEKSWERAPEGQAEHHETAIVFVNVMGQKLVARPTPQLPIHLRQEVGNCA